MAYRRAEIEGAVLEGGYTVAGFTLLAIQRLNVELRGLKRRGLPESLSEQMSRSGRAVFDQLARLRPPEQSPES